MKHSETTILVADDDSGIRFAIVGILQDFGFKVVEASNEDELIERAQKADIWVIDARLPTRSYEGILAVWKLHERYKCTRPVIFTSVDSQQFADKQLDRLEKAKIKFVWLEKPFEPELLVNVIKEH